ncbi:MAG: VOC family protein [Acidimicrobiales bacterium]|nr:VOC family protein [Acidimicrobiales bacterium]
MTVQRLNHVAYRCRDAKETTEFYADVLGLKLVHTIVQDLVPSTQEYTPHAHIFFELGDGSWVAFFDVATEAEVAQQRERDWAQHLALEVESLEILEEKKAALVAHGIDVLGPVDHGFIQSIYFFDPNGHRLELAARTHGPGDLDRYAAVARAAVDDWTARKKDELAAH